jgi:hypothetical protein
MMFAILASIRSLSSFIIGLWLLSDNGYHMWRCLMFPLIAPISEEEQFFTAWLESARKNVECVFGILKKRFKFLKNPIQLHNKVSFYKTFSFYLVKFLLYYLK